MGMLFVQTNITSQALPFFMTDIKQTNKTSIWESWISDWMNRNLPAGSLQESKDIISNQELLHELFLCTGENSISIEVIHQTMLNHDYVFEEGGWLVK